MPVSVLWESRVLWCEVDAGGCRWATVTQLRSYFSMFFCFFFKYHKLLSRCVGSHRLSANERL